MSAVLPDIDVPWAVLQDAADDMAARAAMTASFLTHATSAWQALRASYSEPTTEDRVHTGLDDLKAPMEGWQQSLRDAAGVIGEFVAAGQLLQQRRDDVSDALLVHRDSPAPEEGQNDVEGDRLAGEAADLVRAWAELQELAAERLGAILIGDGAGLPMSASLGGAVLPTVGWTALTSGLDDRFGALDPAKLVPLLVGLDREGLRQWAEVNPDGAALLAGNKLPVRSAEEIVLGSSLRSSEVIMQQAMAGGADLTEEGITGIRNAWTSLPEPEQERLLLLYPAVLGSLNGVPFAQRARANVITVPGNKQILKGQAESLQSEIGHDLIGPGNQGEAAAARQRIKDIDEQIEGLDFATDNDVQVVSVSLEGDGRIVTMTGTPSADTQIMNTLVPGTGANMGRLEDYSVKLANISGKSGADRVSFYWQGTDFPPVIPDNATSTYNEEGGPLLAAFDHAVDLEIPAEARTTYVGYSAGGSMLGTGEREGLDSTNIVYVAPAGTGHEVGGPEDTANPDANRYWIQTRDDPIEAAQVLGGGFHSGSFWAGGNPTAVMGATRLESGFTDPDAPSSLMSGHSDYFLSESTSALNMTGVVEGSSVSLFVQDVEHSTYLGTKVLQSPIEDTPENYANGKLEPTDIASLE